MNYYGFKNNYHSNRTDWRMYITFRINLYKWTKEKECIIGYFENIAFKNNATITKHDLWKDSGIGMDEGKTFVFLFKTN